MQERYLGDSHDFVKFALLRAIAQEGLRLGVNWYLTSPHQVDKESSNDGENRHHLKGDGWAQIDPELLEMLKRFEEPSQRALSHVQEWGILPPETVYYNRPVEVERRTQWHSEAKAHLRETDVVFVDPDNGFQVRSMTKKRSSKYVLFDEAHDYLRAGQTLVVIQFAGRGKPVDAQAHDLVARFEKSTELAGPHLVLRARVTPNILFLITGPKTALLADPLKRLVARSAGRIEKLTVPRRLLP